MATPAASMPAPTVTVVADGIDAAHFEMGFVAPASASRAEQQKKLGEDLVGRNGTLVPGRRPSLSTASSASEQSVFSSMSLHQAVNSTAADAASISSSSIVPGLSPRTCAPLPLVPKDIVDLSRPVSYHTGDFSPAGSNPGAGSPDVSRENLVHSPAPSSSGSGSSRTGSPRTGSPIRHSVGESAPSNSTMKASDYKQVFEYGMQQLQRGKAPPGHKRNLVDGIKVMRGLNARGVAPATYQLAVEAAAGTIDEPAFPYFQRAARMGHANACFVVANAYLDEQSRFVTRDENKALAYHLRAARKNHAGSALWLGRHLLHKDAPEAVRWLHVAAQHAKQNFAEAPYELGLLYQRGLDPVLQQDVPRAIQLWTKAAEMGCDKACLRLGEAFLSGRAGCTRDLTRAFFFFELGAGVGDPGCLLHLSEIYLCGAQNVLRNEARAFDYADMAAQRGSVKALYITGNMMVSGIGVERDLDEGLQRIRRAAEDHEYGPAATYLRSREWEKPLPAPAETSSKLAQLMRPRSASAASHTSLLVDDVASCDSKRRSRTLSVGSLTSRARRLSIMPSLKQNVALGEETSSSHEGCDDRQSEQESGEEQKQQQVQSESKMEPHKEIKGEAVQGKKARGKKAKTNTEKNGTCTIM